MNGGPAYPEYPSGSNELPEQTPTSSAEEEDRIEEIRCFVAPLSKEQLIDLVAQAALVHQDVHAKCTEAVASSPSARRLMVRNVPFSTMDETFVALFKTFGELDDALIVREKDGRSRGYGFVTYKYLDSVRACLQGTHHLDGKELYVKLAADTYTDNSQRKLFIRNLPDTATEENLREIFSQFGTLQDCSVVKSKDGASKGYGFLTFSTHKEAVRAVQQQERVIGQRVVFIHFAAPPADKRRDNMRGSGRGSSMANYYARGNGRDRGRDNFSRRWVGAGVRDSPENHAGAAAASLGMFGFPYSFAPNVFQSIPQSFSVPYPRNVASNSEFYPNGLPSRYS